MKYVQVTKNQYGHTEMNFDSIRFAQDIATELGGTAEPYGETYDKRAKIILPDSIELFVYWQGYGAAAKAGKVSIEVQPDDVPYDLRPVYGSQYKLPSINVDTNRPLNKIAADIKRRLLPAAEAPIAARREYASKRQRKLSNMASARDSFAKEFPQFHVRGENDKASFSYYESGKIHISGRINEDQSITIDSLGALSAEQFRAVCAILYR